MKPQTFPKAQVLVTAKAPIVKAAPASRKTQAIAVAKEANVAQTVAPELTAREIHERTRFIEARLATLKLQELQLSSKIRNAAKNFDRNGMATTTRPAIDGRLVSIASARATLSALRKQKFALSSSISDFDAELRELAKHPNNTANTRRLPKGPSGGEARNILRTLVRPESEAAKETTRQHRRMKQAQREVLIDARLRDLALIPDDTHFAFARVAAAKTGRTEVERTARRWNHDFRVSRRSKTGQHPVVELSPSERIAREIDAELSYAEALEALATRVGDRRLAARSMQKGPKTFRRDVRQGMGG